MRCIRRFFKNRFFNNRGRGCGRVLRFRLARDATPNCQHNVIVERAGMRLFVRIAQLWQHIQNDIGFYFKLASQLINSNLTHKQHLKCHSHFRIGPYPFPRSYLFARFQLHSSNPVFSLLLVHLLPCFLS